MNGNLLYYRNDVNTICSAKTLLVRGFTIVELLVAIVVIGILAAIIIVAYNTMTQSAAEASLKSDLAQAVKVLDVDRAKNGNSYPLSIAQTNRGKGLQSSDMNSFQYKSDGQSYCLTITSKKRGSSAYRITNADTLPVEGICSGHKDADGNVPLIIMQKITVATCPTERTMVVDARDNNTYWIQKLGGACWMLTNLAYAGSGTNTYGDSRYLMNGTSDTSTTYTAPKYYITPGANPTKYPTEPTVSTSGGQYGYLYNFCGVTGAQSGFGGCSSTSSTSVDLSISVCPSGWRLPSAGNGGEFSQLNSTVNNGSTSTDSGLRTGWLAPYSGVWNLGFSGQGNTNSHWSYMQSSTTYARIADGVNSLSAVASKNTGRAARCVAY